MLDVKTPLFFNRRGFFVFFFAVVVGCSAVIKIPIFYKHAHVSQHIFSLLFLNIVVLSFLCTNYKIKTNANHVFIIFFVLFISIFSLDSALQISVLSLYALVALIFSCIKLNRYSSLLISYTAVISAVYSFSLFFSSKLGLSFLPGGRAYGVYGQPNLVAALMLLGFFSYAHILSETGRKRFIYFVPSVLMATLLFLTASRAGMVAVSLSILCVLPTWRKKQLLQTKPFFLKLLVVLIVSYVMASSLGDWTPLSRAESSWGNDGGTYVRLVYWFSAILMGRDFWFSGAGFGGYAGNLGNYAIHACESLKLTYDTVSQTLWAHNDFLHILAEHGIIVFLLFIIFIGGLCLRLLRNLTRHNIFIFLGAISFVCMMCFGHPLYYHNLALMASLLLSSVIRKLHVKTFEINKVYMSVFIFIVLMFINFNSVNHFTQMYQLQEFRKYMILSKEPFTQKFLKAEKLYLHGNITNAIYGWQFKHNLYVNLVDKLIESDNKEVAYHALPDMIEYAEENHFPSYLFSLAKLYYLLDDYGNAKIYAQKSYDRKPDVSQYFDLLHLCNALLISKNNGIKIDKLISENDLDNLRRQNVLRSRQFDNNGIAL
jgi:O-antigen ligase